jgi:drug/metabolite transporter (DMT)-like permease
MSPARPSDAVWAELALLALIWGASFFSIAVALREMGPLTAVWHRVFWAALILWVVAAARGLRPPRDLTLWRDFAAMGLLNNVIPFSLMAWGQTRIETGLVAIFNAATAIFGALVAAALLREERLTRRRALGIGLGFAGVVLMIGVEALDGLDMRSVAQGAVALGALSYAFASVWAKVRLRGVPPVLAAAGMLSCSAGFAAPLAWAAEGAPRLDLSWSSWAAIVWFAGLGTAAAYLLYYRILARAGAADLMLVTLLIPPLSIALGAGFLGERFGPEAALGFALLAAGLIVIDGRLIPGRATGGGAREGGRP